MSRLQWDTAKRFTAVRKGVKSGPVEAAEYHRPYTVANREERHEELAAVTAKPFGGRGRSWEKRLAAAHAVHAAS